jgi:serine/threonine-protein kinase
MMPRTKFDWTFWILWIAATTIGLAFALIVRQWVVGLIIGLAQWLVLWNRFPKPGWWILATTMAFGLAGSPAWNLAIAILRSGWGNWRYSIDKPIVLGVTGAIVGLFQFLVLRRWVYQAGWWIVASPLAGIAAGVLAMIVFDVVFLNMDSPIMDWFLPVITGLAAGLVYGAITGYVLVRLSLNPIANQQ